jgi:hypothetical protein
VDAEEVANMLGRSTVFSDLGLHEMRELVGITSTRVQLPDEWPSTGSKAPPTG